MHFMYVPPDLYLPYHIYVFRIGDLWTICMIKITHVVETIVV